MKTLIAIPCMDMVPIQFAQSLACLNRVGETVIACNIGSLIYESRNKLAMQAIQAQTDYVLWLDSDHQLPPDFLEKGAAHMAAGRDIVSGIYYRRTVPYSPVLFKKLEYDHSTGHMEHEGYDNYPEDGGPFEIAGCGFGGVMMKTQVLFDVMAKYGTCFAPLHNNGEDVAFCVRARELGYKIWADPDMQMGHVGHVVITKEFYNAFHR